jgi:glutaredoxin 3
MKAVIWSKPGCTFCTTAAKLLQSKGYEIEERKIGFGWNTEQLLNAVPGAKSVPQIFIEDTYVGGYGELKKYLEEAKK